MQQGAYTSIWTDPSPNPFGSYRHFTISMPQGFRPVHMALVRPIPVISLQTSSPYSPLDICSIDCIQGIGTRMVKHVREFPFEDQLRRIRLMSNLFHRHRGDLFLVNEKFYSSLELPQTEASAEQGLQEHCLKLRHRILRLLRGILVHLEMYFSTCDHA